MALLEVDGVTSGYGDMEVLRNVSITVDDGEIVSIIGPNGAGKSTLMKAVFGLLHPWQGKITLAGTDISQYSPFQIVRERTCYVPQVSNVFTSMSVEDNLEIGAYTLEKSAIGDALERVYALFPVLKERRRQKAGTMSGGQRQMVAMGSALMLNPVLILLDEPSAGLSPKLVDTIFERIVTINETGVAVLMVEQNAQASLRMAHRGYVLASGKNRVDGPAQSLLDDPEVGRLYLGG